jgi:hypothetical protein
MAPKFYKHLSVLLAALLTIGLQAQAQRTWHLVGDSVGVTDYIGTNNARDFRIKTDSITRMTIRSTGEVVVEGNIIDSTGSLHIDSIRARVIHVGDSSLVIGGFTSTTVPGGPNPNYILSNNATPIVIGHTNAGGGTGNNIWNTNLGVGIAVPQAKLHLNSYSTPATTSGTPNDCFALFTNGHNGWNNPQPTLGFRIGLASNRDAEVRQRHPNRLDLYTSDIRRVTIIGADNNPLTGGNNSGYVGIGTVSTPLSQLHLGDESDALIFGGTAGWRSWMQYGTYVCRHDDNVFFGLKPNEDNVNIDRNDAVIAWGDNISGDPTKGPDQLRIIFNSNLGNTGTPGTGDGLEISRYMPDGNVGIGNFSSTPGGTGTQQAPLSRLSVKGNESIGIGYAGTTAAPVNGLLVQGVTQIGDDGTGPFPTPSGAQLEVLNATTPQLRLINNAAGFGESAYFQATPTGDLGITMIDGAGFPTNPYGNLGINITTPEATLDVNGNANIRDVQNDDLIDKILVWDDAITPTAMHGRVKWRDAATLGGGIVLGAKNAAWIDPGDQFVEWGTNPLLHNTEVPMIDPGNNNEYNIFYSGQSQMQNAQASIGIGYLFNDPINAKLDVRSETFSSPGTFNFVNQYAGNFHNTGTYDIDGGTDDLAGVHGICDVIATVPSLTTHIGGDFIASGSFDGLNIGVRGEANGTGGSGNIGVLARSTTPQDHVNYGVAIITSDANVTTGLRALTGPAPYDVTGALFTTSGAGPTFETNGVVSNVYGNDEGTHYAFRAGSYGDGDIYNYGVYSTADGFAKQNVGVFGEAYNADPSNNYGVWGKVATAGAGAGDWAGYFDGDVLTTSTTYYLSDENLKLNVTDIEIGTASSLIAQLTPKSYIYDSENYPSITLPPGQQYGLLAQEVEQVLPEFVKQVHTPVRYDSSGVAISQSLTFKGVNYVGFVPILIAAVKDLDKENHKLDSVNQAQNERLQLLEEKIASLADCCSKGSAPQGADQRVDLSDYAIILDQNSPNPFAEQTKITYVVPVDIKDARILFSDNNGRVLKTVTIAERGPGSLTVYASNLSSGVYTYSLIADNKLIDTKKMNCTK